MLNFQIKVKIQKSLTKYQHKEQKIFCKEKETNLILINIILKYVNKFLKNTKNLRNFLAKYQQHQITKIFFAHLNQIIFLKQSNFH